MREQRLDGLAVAVDDVERRRPADPASASHSAISSEADGSFSLGLRMNALPHASASGYIHIGTIAGKLNGVMPTATPSGWRSECESTPVADLLGRLALEQVRGAAGELDDLEPALDLPARVVERLAVLGGDHAGQVARSRAASSSRNLNRTLERLASDSSLQVSKPAWAAATARSTSAALANATRRTTRAGGRIGDLAVA